MKVSSALCIVFELTQCGKADNLKVSSSSSFIIEFAWCDRYRCLDRFPCNIHCVPYLIQFEMRSGHFLTQIMSSPFSYIKMENVLSIIIFLCL